MELRNLSNEDVFERWRRELGFRYRTDKPRKEAIRFIGLFEKFLAGRPPCADFAKEFLSHYAHRKQNTRAGYSAQLAMFMKWYGDPIDDCRVSPAEDMPELVDARDLDKVEEAIRNRKTHKKLVQRDILLVRTLRYTGIRRAEAAHLRVCDIDVASRMLMVRGGKGCKDRAIPMLDSLMTEMQTYCAAKQRGDLVFGLKDVSVSGLVSIWARKAGVPHIHAHSYRHFFGTELARRGVTAREIQRLMGHRHMSTSQCYIDLAASDLRSAIDRLGESPPKHEFTGVPAPSCRSLLDNVLWACQKYVQSQLDQLLHPPRHKFCWELEEGEQPSMEGLVAVISRSY